MQASLKSNRCYTFPQILRVVVCDYFQFSAQQINFFPWAQHSGSRTKFQPRGTFTTNKLTYLAILNFLRVLSVESMLFSWEYFFSSWYSKTHTDAPLHIELLHLSLKISSIFSPSPRYHLELRPNCKSLQGLIFKALGNWTITEFSLDQDG